MPKALDVVTALMPKSFVRKDTGKAEVGFIAQDVQGVVPGAVAEYQVDIGGTEDDPKTQTQLGLYALPMIAMLWTAVQELTARVEALDAEP